MQPNMHVLHVNTSRFRGSARNYRWQGWFHPDGVKRSPRAQKGEIFGKWGQTPSILKDLGQRAWDVTPTPWRLPCAYTWRCTPKPQSIYSHTCMSMCRIVWAWNVALTQPRPQPMLREFGRSGDHGVTQSNSEFNGSQKCHCKGVGTVPTWLD